MRKIEAYEASDSTLFRSKEDCLDHEYLLTLKSKSKMLTKAEHKVYICLRQFDTLKEIAEYLDLQLVTIKKHCKNIYEKLGVNNKTEMFRENL